GRISVTGKNGIGMYTSAGTVINDGDVIIGSNGVGIYGETYPEPNDNDVLNNSFFTVKNNKNIVAVAGEKAVGIYLNNNAPAGKTGTGTVNLGTASNIDMRASRGGVGL